MHLKLIIFVVFEHCKARWPNLAHLDSLPQTNFDWLSADSQIQMIVSQIGNFNMEEYACWEKTEILKLVMVGFVKMDL